MPELGGLANLHFLRPVWLLGLVPALALLAFVRWRDDATRAWRGVIDAPLLDALRVRPRRRWHLGPVDLIALVLALGCLAAAGPAWQREPPPFAEDKAPLVIALDLSESMNAIDVPPTRLERAREKIRDLLARRAGARTGLIAYAGSAHLVMPPTDDAAAIETYLAVLEPALMPKPGGKDAAAALARAEQLLDRDETPGSILFVTDGIPAEQQAAFRAHATSRKEGLLVLGVGTSEGGPIRRGAAFATDATGRRVVARLDREGLEALARDTGAFVATATLDARDVDRLQARIQSHLEDARGDDATARWKDGGWFLTLPLALLSALWFRRGWTVRWVALVLLALGLGGASPALAQVQAPIEPGTRTATSRFLDLWLTRDQQGRLAFERGDFPAAAALFEDPMWRGVACYRAGDWDGAVDAFARLETPEAFFNLGNAYARRDDLDLAVTAYDEALKRRAGWREAEENRARVAALILPPPKEDDQEAQGDPNLAPDEVKFDEKGKKGKEGQIDASLFSDQQMGEIWLRGLTTSPAAFLRQKFAVQADEAEAAGEKPPTPRGGRP